MSFRGTWVASGLVVLLAGYTLWEYRNASRDLDALNGERAAFSLERDKVDRLEITEGGVTSKFEKKGDDWTMTAPVVDQAESTAVEGYLFQLLALRLKSFLPPAEAKSADPKQYGLDPARVTITVAGQKKTESIAISTKNAFDGSYYVSANGETLLGDRGLASLAERAASTLRSRRLWRENDLAIESASVRLGDVAYTLKREQEKFVLAPTPGFPVDPERIQRWVDAVQDLVPSDFVKEDPSEADLAEYFLKKPSLVVTFTYKSKTGEAKEWVLTIGQDRGDDTYLFTNVRPTVYKAAKTAVDKIRATPLYFRDGHAPFQFEVEDAREVKWKDLVLKKTDAGWTAASGVAADSELDQEKLVQLVQNVRSLEAQEYPEQAKGMPRTSQVEIRGENGKSLRRLAWGDEFKAQSPWNAGLVFRFVSVDGGKPLGVLKDRLAAIDNAGLVRKKK